MMSHSRTNNNKYFSLSSISNTNSENSETLKFKIKHNIRHPSKLRVPQTLNQEANAFATNVQSESVSPNQIATRDRGCNDSTTKFALSSSRLSENGSQLQRHGFKNSERTKHNRINSQLIQNSINQKNTFTSRNIDVPGKPDSKQKQMGVTFGDGGFKLKPVKHTRKHTDTNESPNNLKTQRNELEVIYETEHQPFQNMRSSINSNQTKLETQSNFNSAFKENMLLSFYNWPKVESSAVKQEPLMDFPNIKKTLKTQESQVQNKVNKRCSLQDLNLFTVNEDQLSNSSNLDYSDQYSHSMHATGEHKD